MSEVECITDSMLHSAVEALKSCVKKLKESQKDLFAVHDSDYIHLQFGFKKIPLQQQTIKIVLPHPVIDDTSSVCLFVSDVDRRNRDYSETVDKYRELIDELVFKQQIDVIPLKQLKLEYKEHESKRNLLSMYDMFLADSRIVRLLPTKLGKHFFKRKRFPVQVNLSSRNFQREISQALSTSCCTVAGRGSSGQMTVAKLSQSTSDVTENIAHCVRKLAASLPGGWSNVRSVHLKAQDTPSVPVYVSFGCKDDVVLPRRVRRTVHSKPEDVSTVENGAVIVSVRRGVRVVKRQNKKQLSQSTINKSALGKSKFHRRKLDKKHQEKQRKMQPLRRGQTGKRSRQQSSVTEPARKSQKR